MQQKQQETAAIAEIETPTKDICDILLDADECKDTDDIETSQYTWTSSPNVIINDWFYLGNAQNALDLTTLKKLGITHILNVTDSIRCYFNKNEDFQYAQIRVDDIEEADLFNYFEATAKFIDQCNPYYYYKDKEVMQEMQTNIDWKQPKILVHCAAGISRSSTIVISYLMSRIVRYNQIEQNILNYITKELDHEVTVKHKRYLTLSEAFYYVQSCRNIIWPNNGFMDQLEKYELLCNKVNKQSTRNEIDIYSTISIEAKLHANKPQIVGKSSMNVNNDHDYRICESCNIL